MSIDDLLAAAEEKFPDCIPIIRVGGTWEIVGKHVERASRVLGVGPTPRPASTGSIACIVLHDGGLDSAVNRLKSNGHEVVVARSLRSMKFA